MEKYITSVKDFVLETLSDFSLIRTSADRGDADSCFKMGLVHLLGIKKQIDFTKAARYFSNKSLADNKDANRLLAYIAECEGDFSKAFQNYAKASSSEKDSYLDATIKQRKQLQSYFKKLELPDTFNKELSVIFSDYAKGKASRVGACIKIAAICNDEPTCYEVAKIMYDSNDYISAIQWLQRGKIDSKNSLYTSINEKITKSLNNCVNSNDLQIIELANNSLIDIEDPTPFLETVKEACNQGAKKASDEWRDKTKKRIDTIIRVQEELEEKQRLEAEAEDEAREKKRKAIIMASAFGLAGFILGVMVEGTFMSGIKGAVGILFWYFLIKWYLNRKKDNNKKNNRRKK